MNYTRRLLLLALIALRPDLADASSCTLEFRYFNEPWYIQESTCATRSVLAAAELLKEAAAAQERDDKYTMCQKAAAAMATMEPYRSGGWRDHAVTSVFDKDYETIFAEFRKLHCQQKIDLYRKRAEAGEAWAMFNLGVVYESGEVVSPNIQTAISWYEKAAALQDIDAMTNLAVLYADGKLVPQDQAAATRWYIKAGEAGDSDSQYYVGVRYRKGIGAEQDFAKAAEWFGKSAKQGDKDAKSQLKEMKKAGEIKKTFGLF